MNIETKIKNYQTNLNKEKKESIFLDLADEIINDYPYRLSDKTYLLIPNSRQELIEMAYEHRLTEGRIMPETLTLTMSKIMKKFNEIAEKLGFTIITEISEYRNDGRLYDLQGVGFSEEGLIKEECKNLNNVKIPFTLSVDEFMENPYLPAVFKNNSANRGEDKYLIETKEQLAKIISLFELPESKKINLKSEFVVQEYIKGFEGFNSSIRVYSSCTGEIISSLFLVSTDKEPKKRVKNFGVGVFNPCEYLSDPDSPYYLNSKNIISNAAGGGKIIPLNKEISTLNANDEIILALHEIDISTLSLPKTIIQQCKEIANFWGTEKGIVLGIDFIYDYNKDDWYYLETNRNPSVEGYARFMNLIGYQKKDVKTLMQLESLTKIVEHIMTVDMQTNKTRTK